MKTIKTLIILAIVLLPIRVFAASGITVSPETLTVEVGKTKTFEIVAVNTIGDVDTIVSSDTTVATVDKSSWTTGQISDGLTKKGTITVTGVKVGEATITLTLDASTFDEESLTGQTRTVKVNVVAKGSDITDPKDNPKTGAFTSVTLLIVGALAAGFGYKYINKKRTMM